MIAENGVSIAEEIGRRLTEKLNPRQLEVIDESAAHAGHMGASAAGETHFRVVVVSDSFTGMTRIARQRLVNEIMADLLAGRVHAFSARLATPAEIDGRTR
jgi:BolA protein